MSLVVWMGSAGVALAGWAANEVPGTTGDYTVPQLVVGRDGTTLLGLLSSRGLAVSRVTGGAPGAPVLLAPATTPFGENSLITLTPRRRLVAGGTESTSGGSRAWIAEGPLGGPLGPQRTIVPRTRAGFAFAASARGDVAIAVADTAGRGGLRVVVRNVSGAVRSYRIFTGRQGAFGLAFNDRADLLVAGSLVDQPAGLYTLKTRLLSASGRLGPLRRVAQMQFTVEDGDGSSLHVALADDGRGLLGWDLLPCGAGGGCGRSILGFAASRRGARGWRARRLAILPRGEEVTATPVLVAAGRNDGQIAWGEQRPGGIQVRTAAVHGRGLKAAVALSRPGTDARPSALAMTGDRAAAVVWTERTTAPDPVGMGVAGLHAVSRAGTGTGPFTSPQPVWDGQVLLGTQVSLVLEPSSGRPLAAWPNEDPTNGMAGPLIVARG